MTFSMEVWHEYRNRALAIAAQIADLRDKNDGMKLKIEILDPYIGKITSILEECTDYMDNCNMPRATKLWDYNIDDPTSHASSKSFKYKDKMTNSQIKTYGDVFMSK